MTTKRDRGERPRADSAAGRFFRLLKKEGKTAIFFKTAKEPPPPGKAAAPPALDATSAPRPTPPRAPRASEPSHRTGLFCVFLFYFIIFFLFTPPTAFPQAASAAPMNNGDTRFGVGKPATSCLPSGDD
jgi:hypothetical protein